MTLGPLVVFKKLPGDQLIVPVAKASIVTLSPIHIVVSLGKVMVGALTFSVNCRVSDPQESATITERSLWQILLQLGLHYSDYPIHLLETNYKNSLRRLLIDKNHLGRWWCLVVLHPP